MIGNACFVLGFIFIGPLPFIPIGTNLVVTTIATSLGGFAYALVMVSSFARAQAAAIQKGFEQETDNYHFISGYFSLEFINRSINTHD